MKSRYNFFEDTSKDGNEIPKELEAVLESDKDAFQIFDNLNAGKKRSLLYVLYLLKEVRKKNDKALIMCVNLKLGNFNHFTIFKFE
jgi:hypothetical protein